MWSVIGWILWGLVVYFAVSYAYGCRRYVASGQGFHLATGVQAFFWWLIAVVFLITRLNKLHIIWIVPLGFYGAHYIAFIGIPVLSPLVLLATRTFLRLMLLGVRKPGDL